VAGDPLADRRRERALKALDKRIADMKSKIKVGVQLPPV
jgi:hypothetical protein